MGWLYWILGIVVGLIVIAVLAMCMMRSHFTTLSYACEDAYAVVDRFLKKRYDLLPGLIDIIQEYAAHETGIVENLMACRNVSMKAASLMEKCEAESKLTDALRETFATAEKYQPLRVSAALMTLKHDMRAVEQDIANAGDQYNRCARRYNEYFEQALPNIVATVFARKQMAEFAFRQSVTEE